MQLEMHIIDAFTDTPFRGNPAAVIFGDHWLPDDLMQAIATENNLSETAFVVPNEHGVFGIRWFSPITEIEFCGHATLASAYVYFTAHPEQNSMRFHAKAVGELQVLHRDDGFIQMRFPRRAPQVLHEVPPALVDGLSVPPKEVWLNEQAYFAIYEKEESVLNIAPHMQALKRLAPYDVVVTAPGKRFDFVSRYFWPANGGEEDPVTGSIHAGLAPFWAGRLGKNTLNAFQASARGGNVHCEVADDHVLICGKARPYLKGHIQV